MGSGLEIGLPGRHHISPMEFFVKKVLDLCMGGVE